MALPRIVNDTDFVAEPHVLVDRDGEKLCVIVKATFELAVDPTLATDGTFTVAPRERRRGIRAADVPWGKPEVSSIRYPSDLYVNKPGTEVIVVAVAHAPGGKPVSSFEAGARVGRLSRTVRVTGPRVWVADGSGLTSPGELTSLPMRWEHSFGGFDRTDPDQPVEDAQNPIGTGVARDPASLTNKPAPQVEDPSEPLKDIGSKPKPAGLGPLGRHWEPRRKLWGSYGGDWVEKRAPLPPLDFDDRASFSAPAQLVATPALTGGEEGSLENLTPGGGTINFALPRLDVKITYRARNQEPISFSPSVDTIVLDTVAVPPPTPDRSGRRARACPLAIELVLRASVPAPRRWGAGEVLVTERRKK